MIDFIAFTELNCGIVFRSPYAEVRTPRTEILEFTRILIRPLLQLRDPVAAARKVRGEWEHEGPGPVQEDLASGVAPHSAERALHLS